MAAKIDPQLEKVVPYLQERAKQNEKAGLGTDGRHWFDLKELDVETRDEIECHDAFTREACNADYVKARQNDSAEMAEVIVPKLCGDFLMGLERDFRMRRRTRVRQIVHQAGRARGMGQASGPLRRNTIDWMTRSFLKAE